MSRYTGSPGCPKRSRKQLACQLDDLIASMDSKIRLSIEEREAQRTSGATAADARRCDSAQASLRASTGLHCDDDDDDDDDGFSDIDEYAIDLEDNIACAPPPLVRSMENFWWYNQHT